MICALSGLSSTTRIGGWELSAMRVSQDVMPSQGAIRKPPSDEIEPALGAISPALTSDCTRENMKTCRLGMRIFYDFSSPAFASRERSHPRSPPAVFTADCSAHQAGHHRRH